LDGLAEGPESLKREGGALERNRVRMGCGAAVGVQKPGHASSDLGSRERTYCAGALPPEQAAREPNAKRAGKCHAHYTRCTRCQLRATSRRGGQSAALEPFCPPSSLPFSTAPPRGTCRPRRLRHLRSTQASPSRSPPHQPLRAALIRSRTSGLRKFVYLRPFRPVLSTDSVTMSQCLQE